MASLQEIKTRLSSVATTKKITKAMQLVATAKLKRAKKSFNGIQEYYTSVYEIFQGIQGNVKNIDKIIPKTKNDCELYIVFTSDLGLCGSYNSNIFKLVKSKIRSKDKIVVLGSKGSAYYKTKKQKLHMDFPSIGDDPNYNVCSNIGQNAVSMYLTGEIKAIKVIHTKYINTVSFEPIETKVLPVEKKPIKIKQNALTEFEPDPETVIKNGLPLYVSAILFGSMVETKVSEMSSRRTAMENASDNADELIEKLELQYNRARQASITQEITEIISGSNAK